MNGKLVSRTHFTRKSTQNEGWQWFWATKTPDEQDTVGVGGEGYHRIHGAVNGFMSQQGVSSWEPIGGIEALVLPEGYALQKISDDHYVLTKHEIIEGKVAD